jgi:hypothetical protein
MDVVIVQARYQRAAACVDHAIGGAAAGADHRGDPTVLDNDVHPPTVDLGVPDRDALGHDE